MSATIRNFVFVFTQRHKWIPEGVPKRRAVTMPGLNELDARQTLIRQLHRKGQALHAMLEVVQLRNNQTFKQALREQSA